MRDQYVLMDDTFRNIFLQRICQRYKYLSRKRNNTEIVFSKQITKPFSEGGLEINEDVFDLPEIQRKLLEIQTDGLIQLISDNQFRLTPNGIEYCKRLPETFG